MPLGESSVVRNSNGNSNGGLRLRRGVREKGEIGRRESEGGHWR